MASPMISSTHLNFTTAAGKHITDIIWHFANNAFVFGANCFSVLLSAWWNSSCSFIVIQEDFTYCLRLSRWVWIDGCLKFEKCIDGVHPHHRSISFKDVLGRNTHWGGVWIILSHSVDNTFWVDCISQVKKTEDQFIWSHKIEDHIVLLETNNTCKYTWSIFLLCPSCRKSWRYAYRFVCNQTIRWRIRLRASPRATTKEMQNK